MANIPLGQKFHTKSHFMDTVERRSPQLNANVETYTMQDIVDTVGGNITVEGAADASTIYDGNTGMISDTDLAVGDIIETRGYTTPGDGGAATYVVSATGTVDGGSVIALDNGLVAVTDFGGITCPTQWGAVKNSSASASENVTAFNSMFGYIESLGGEKCSVNVSTGVYHLNGDVLLPRAIIQNEDAFHADFNNSELKAAANDITLLKRVYNGGQESSKISILNCNFTGTGFTGVTGIDIQGGYNCQILNGDYTGVAKGIELGFALNTHMSNLKFTSALRGVNIGLKDGTNTNAQSNVTTMYKCRFYSAKATDYAVHIDRVSGVVIEDCIFEGFQPTEANIFFNGQSSVVNDCTIIGCHAESAGHADSGDNTHVEYTGGARLKLQRVFAQATNTFVDPENVVQGREILHMYGGNAYVDMSLYYYTPSFSIRNDTNGYFHMSDAQLNTTLPSNMNTTPLNWTGTVGEPLYFAIERANDGISISRGRAIQTSDTGGGVSHTHFLKASGAGEVDVLKGKRWDSWAGSYEGNVNRLYGSNLFHYVSFDQKAYFTNQDLNVETATHGELKQPVTQKPNSISVELEVGETGKHEHTLCPATGRPTVYTTTAVPTTASDAGKKGEIRSDATHMYICIADDTWIKSALTSF